MEPTTRQFSSRAAHWLRLLAAHVEAIARAKPTTEQAAFGRYAGWCWCDTTERALIDDLVGRNSSFRP